MSRLKDIPALQRDGSNLSTVMQAVQEVIQTFRGYRGDKLDKALTLRDLSLAAQRGLMGGGSMDTGIIGGSTPALPVTGAYVIDPTPPPTPTGLAVNAAITSLFVSCDAPVYTQGHGHAVTVVYGAKWPTADLTQPTFSEAVELYRFQGTFSSYATDPATRWCIWIKWQSVDGFLSTDPAGGTNGVVATTGQDVALLLDALAGEITASELHAALGTRINLIDAPDTTAGSVNFRLSAEAATRASAIAAEAATRAAALLAEAGTRTTAVNDLQNQIDTVVAVAGGDLSSVIAVVQEEQTARAAADAAEAASRETLAVQLRGAYTGTDASATTTGLIYSERQARITATETEVSERNAAIVSNLASTEAMQKVLNDAMIAGLGVLGGAAATRTQAEQDARIASVTAETNARISAIDAEATARLALVAVVNANAAILTSEQTTRATDDSALGVRIDTVIATANTDRSTNSAAITAEQTARADADAAEAAARTTLQATVDGHTSAISTEATTRASQTGALFAQYTVKLDVDGKVSGYGLASTGPTGAGSTFEVRSNKFVIAAETGGAAGFVPFQVLTAPTVIDGVTLPAGAYATNAFIQNLQVTNGKIANLAVDDAKIASLSAAKITAGSIAVGQYIQGTGYVAGSAGWRINGDGTAELNNVVVRGTVYAAAGLIGGNTIDATSIHSGTTGYGTGSGFYLGSNGTMSLGTKLTWNGTVLAIDGTGTFSGALTAATIATASGKFSVSSGGILTAVDGNFSGAITGSTMVVGTGGFIRSGQTAYNTGVGWWLGDVAGTPKFSIGNPAGVRMLWDGTDLLINTPTFEAFSASVGGAMSVSVAYGLQTYGSRTVTPSGGKAPYTYVWISQQTGGGGRVYVGNSTSATVSLSGEADGSTISAVINCFVTDANGRLTMASFNLTATHGPSGV
jgi:hypothetical protein